MRTNNDIKNCINKMKEIYGLFLKYIDNIDPISEIDYKILIQYLDTNKIPQNKGIFNNFIQIIINISNDHHRQPNFFNKIERILINYKNIIEEGKTNIDIYQQFESSKRLLYFLIKENILKIDMNINRLIENKIDFDGSSKYSNFFLSEITNKDLNDETLTYYMNNLEEYEEKRLIGENDSYICSLIRQDSIEDFVAYVSRNNLSFSSKIKPSIFETNSFLIGKNPTLIEYAAFFGSIQIFEYLYLNQAEISGSLWLYGIHSNNPDLLRNYIESNQIEPEDETYKEIFKESIKCHHNDIARYIQDNYINENNHSKIDEQIFIHVSRCHNYSFFPNEFNQAYAFYYLCENNEITLVNLLVKDIIESKTKKDIFKYY